MPEHRRVLGTRDGDLPDPRRHLHAGVPLYLAATLIAFASPIASAIMYLAIAAFYIFESSLFGGAQSAD